jgi:hypothetical protein
MNGGPSSSGRDNLVDELCVLFPQAERSVLEAVLETEGSFDAAVEALLQSVVLQGQDKDVQIRNDEQLARALQAQSRGESNISPWPGWAGMASEQVVGASWEGLKQVAADVTQTVSDGVVAFAQGVGNLVAPLYEDEEDEDDSDDSDSQRPREQEKRPENKKDK